MSVLVGNETRLIIKGITGTEGSFHGRQIREYGTHLVGGVTPGKEARKHLKFLFLIQWLRPKLKQIVIHQSYSFPLPLLQEPSSKLQKPDWIWSSALQKASQ